MPTTFTSTLFANTYKDDYRDSDNYHRVLFNSGKALQARELTQLQTIIQSEIGRFARNIFNEGAMVNPGGIMVNNKYEYITLDTSINTLGSVAVGDVYQYVDQAIQVRVINVVPADALTGDPATLYVVYIKTDEADIFSEGIRIPDGADIEKVSGSGPTTLTLEASNASGAGTFAAVSAGEYFTKDHFVFTPSQSIIVSKYSNTPTTDLGFTVTEDVVTVEDNSALYDNQGAIPNTASPGADRYRIRLTLTTRDEIDSADNFIYIARIVNGIVSLESKGFTDYNRIADALAERTREESGDYVVNSYTAKFSNLNDSNLSLAVNPGVAYIDGYRVATSYTNLTVPKARTYALDDRSIVAQYGNYILQDSNGGNAGIPNINNFQQVNLRNATQYGGSTIGTAHVRAGERYGSTIRWYLFDIIMNQGESFSSVKSFGTATSDYVDVKLTDGIALLNETANNSLLFPLPNKRARTAEAESLVVQRRYAFTVSTGTSEVVTIDADDYPNLEPLVFTDPGDWIVTSLTGSITAASGVVLNIISGGTQCTVTNLPNGNYEILALVNIADPVVKTKTRTNVTETFAWPTDADSSNGYKWLTLSNTDIINFTRIRVTDSDGADLSANFDYDNGQRDNFYGKGRLIQKPGLTIPTGDVFVRYTYFAHGSGHYFSVNSYGNAPVYGGAGGYENIPTYRKNNGETISLADVLDFRPNQIGTSGTDNYQDSSKSVMLLPQNNNVIDMSSTGTTYWLGRKDKLIVKNNETGSRLLSGGLEYIQGEPAFDPIEPASPDNSLTLFKYTLNPYVINDSDLKSEFIENKGYTMKEISDLERRIDRLEEYTTLNLLEANTALQLVLDSAGLPRTKSGFLADPFKDHAFAELDNEYRASINQEDNTLVSPFTKKNVRLIFDSADVNNTVTLTGDLITLAFTEATFVNQNLATETINVNPFDVVLIGGQTTLSPSSDEWIETTYAADNIIDNGGASIVGDINTLRNAVANGWLGGGTVVGSNIVRRIVGERVISVSVIPWMRSKKVYFQTTGLRRNTRYFAYFNNTAVDSWVRDTSGDAQPFRYYATTTESFGNLYNNATEHPDGSSILVTDDTGTLTGSFFIPSTPAIKFRTGVGQFKLLDVSGNNDAGATSWSTATFTSAGTLETRQRDILSTRVNVITPPPPPVQAAGSGTDPLSQTFFIDGAENPNGIFLTALDLFFETKDAVEPVRVNISEVENGYPTLKYLPGAQATLLPSQVAIPADINDLTSVRAAPTKFTFDEPVYLSPNTEYAIVIKANSTGYNTYVAKTYDYLLGTTAARVTKQPTTGSLFISQNARTWTADQTRDLMFKLYRAEFSSSGSAYFTNGAIEQFALKPNPLRFISGDSDCWVSMPGHGFSKNDAVNISGVDVTTVGLDSSDIIGSRLISEVDWSGFKIGCGAQATASLITGGSSVVVDQQAYFDEVYPVMQTIMPKQTGIAAYSKFTSGGSYAGTLYNRATGSNIRAKASSFSPIVLNQNNLNTNPKVILSSANETKWLSGSKSAEIKVDMVTLDTKVSPVIDLQRASLILTENFIDKQDSASSAGFNIPLFFVNETSPSGGSSAAKHTTKQIVLAEQAIGLKILLSANRPTESNFDLYYRTATSDEVLGDKTWTLLPKQSELPGDNDGTTYREYEYLAGGIGGTLAPFTMYQVKIVMNSTNSSRIPKLKDLRVIALAT